MSSCGKNENPQEMNRRKFLKVFGGGAVASSAALYGCAPKNEPGAAVALGEVPTDKMTYRQHPTNGDKVSILGYGCMRWPLKQGSDGKDQIDQEAVNRLVDYAIEHGVNYFDTSPVYVQGMSEKATGIALARHPRNSYYLATKLSNFRTIREKTRWRCIGSRSVICKPIIWIIICFTLSVGGMVSSFSMTAI